MHGLQVPVHAARRLSERFEALILALKVLPQGSMYLCRVPLRVPIMALLRVL